jgi:predicted nucleotidyltransferase
MHDQASLDKILYEFIAKVNMEFPLRYCYLFGSYAKGNPREYSDIDIAVVSDVFEGNRFNDSEKLIKFVIHTSYDLEVHPFKTEDFTPDNPMVQEILETGKLIPINGE